MTADTKKEGRISRQRWHAQGNASTRSSKEEQRTDFSAHVLFKNKRGTVKIEPDAVSI